MQPIYITTGEPAGIGPDIVLCLAAQGFANVVVALGDMECLAERAQMLNLSINLLAYRGQTEPLPKNSLYVEHIATAVPVVAGQLDPRNAAHVLAQLQRAADVCREGAAAAVVTAPVQKSVMNDAGIAFSGHTEFFQQCAGVDRVVMMLATPQLRVALVTTHLALRAVPDAISATRLRQVLDILIFDLKVKFGLASPKILVCGLNPHAGEGGYLGREEIEVINPVLAEYRAQGVDVGEALPADTLFTPRMLAGADAVLAMYHDQGLPVLKAQGFGEAVNVTLGLPFIRTSVDHGTALSLAGTGQAQASSLAAAYHLAVELATQSIQTQQARLAPVEPA